MADDEVPVSDEVPVNDATAADGPGGGLGLRRKLLAGAGLAALIAVGVAAGVVVTGGDDGDGTGGGGTRPDRTSTGPAQGGTLRMATPGLQSLDPKDARHPAAVMVADLLFDTLVEYEPETFEPRPGLAASWEPDEGLSAFTFRLRRGATFHDGSPVTAADVKATLERIAAPGSVSDVRFLLEVIEGYEAFHVLQSAGELTGVQAVDARTLRVQLVEPFADFPAVMGNPALGIVPAAAGAEPGFADEPVGSGPLQFAGRRGDVVRLERNPDYEPDPTSLDAVEVTLVDDVDDGYALLRDGDVDLGPVSADRVDEAREAFGDEGMGHHLAVTLFGFNLRSPTFEDVRFRQAVLAAANPEAIVDIAYGGSVLPAHGVVPADLPGGVDDACGDRCDHSTGRARRLLAEAFPDGNVPTVVVDLDDDERERRVAAALQAGLEDAGIPVELRPHAIRDYGTFIASGRQELFRFGWIASFPAADNFLTPLFRSDQDSNLVGMASSAVDEVLRAARAEPDRSRRLELYRQAEQLVLDQYAVIPVAQFTNRWAATADVLGFSMTALGTFDVTEISLDRPAGGARR